MEFDIIQSGSSGNCLILNDILALDMGVTWKRVAPYAKKLQLVFCGHAHHDHAAPSTIRKLATERPTIRFCGGEWMAGVFMRSGVDLRQIDILKPGQSYNYGAFQIESFPLVHDVENFGLKIWMCGERALYAVDTGTMESVEFPDADYYFLEANHTRAEIDARITEKQSRGEFAYETRAARNHLSQEQALEWLSRNAGLNSRYIFLHQHKETTDDGL